jgi:AraC-like DNA-binding protein
LDFDIDEGFSELENSLGTALDEDFLPEKAPKYSIPPEFNSPRVMKNAASISGVISESVELFIRREPYYREIASAKIKLALIAMISAVRESRENKLAKRIIEYIRGNFSSPDMTNEKLAAALHYHPYHLNRVMKSHTGKSLREYIVDYRLDMAKNYLITTSDSITEIALACGFQSYTYFIKLFREKNGCPPLKYRAAHTMMGL